MSQGIRSSLKTCWTYALDIAVKVPLLGIQRPLAARSETRGYSHLGQWIQQRLHAYPRSAAPLSSNPCPVTRVFTGRFLFNRSCQSRHCLRAECTDLSLRPTHCASITRTDAGRCSVDPLCLCAAQRI